MSHDHHLTPRELGDRIVWVLTKERSCFLCVAKHLGITDIELRRRLVGLEAFTSLQLTMVSDYLKIRTSALFADTWEEFKAKYYGQRRPNPGDGSMTNINSNLINYMTLEEATKEPDDGFWYVLADRWWSYEPGKGLLLYQNSPQCNKSKSITEAIARKRYPDAQIIFVPRVYLRHDCSEY